MTNSLWRCFVQVLAICERNDLNLGCYHDIAALYGMVDSLRVKSLKNQGLRLGWSIGICIALCQNNSYLTAVSHARDATFLRMSYSYNTRIRRMSGS